MSQEFITWGSIILAGGSVIAVVKFWMDLGAALARATRAETLAENAQKELQVFATRAIENFATVKDLAAAESRFAMAVDGMRSDFRALTDRLDRLLEKLK
jgi:hypothetical protein